MTIKGKRWKMNMDRMDKVLLLMMLSAYSVSGSTQGRCSSPGACNQVTRICNFNDCNLTKLPELPPNTRIEQVILSNNYISNLTENGFQNVSEYLLLLDLSKNNISFSGICEGAFNNLSRLQTLRMAYNKLEFTNADHRKGIFKPLKNLTYLDLQVNFFYGFGGLEDMLLEINTTIKNLSVDGCQNCCFSEKVSHLNALENLVLSGRKRPRSDMYTCQIPHLTKNNTQNLGNIRWLWLARCNISRIHEETFRNLPHLKFLDISYNTDLEFGGAIDAMKGLNESNLEELNLNKLYSYSGLGVTVNSTLVQALSAIPKLKTLHLDLNRIEVINQSAMDHFPCNIKYLYMAGNRILFYKTKSAIRSLYCVEKIDISRQHTSYDPFRTRHYGKTYKDDDWTHNQSNSDQYEPKKLKIFVPSNLTQLKWRHSFINAAVGEMEFVNATNLKILLLGLNLIRKWTGPVKGLENLKELELSDNYCKNASPTFFDGMQSLTVLNVTRNFMGLSLRINDNLLLRSLANLTKLYLSTNFISTIPEMFFANQSSLQELRLDGNLIESTSFMIKHMGCLTLLDLSNNKIAKLPDPFIAELDLVILNQTCRNRNTTRIILKDNPIDCSCPNIEFLTWMHEKIRPDDAGKCTQSGYKHMPLDEVISDLKSQCASRVYIYVMVSAGGTLVVSLVLVKLISRYKWRLRYIYYTRTKCKCRKLRRRRGYDEIRYNFDAFFSYSREECSFVKNVLVPTLGGVYNLNVCVGDRHFVPGACLAEIIIEAISSSRKTVLLISRAYLTNYWCSYELNMARLEELETKRNLLIMVMYEEIPTNELPLDVVRMRAEATVLDYPSNANDQYAFWRTLAEYIRCAE